MAPWVGQLCMLAKSGSRPVSLLAATSAVSNSCNRFGQRCVHKLQRWNTGANPGTHGVRSDSSLGLGSTTTSGSTWSRSLGSRTLADDNSQSNGGHMCEGGCSSSRSCQQGETLGGAAGGGGGGGGGGGQWSPPPRSIYNVSIIKTSAWLKSRPLLSSQTRVFHSNPGQSVLSEGADGSLPEKGPTTPGEQESQETAAAPAVMSMMRMSEREVTDAYIPPIPVTYNFAGVKPDHKAALLSDASKENIWFLHNQNPEEWTVDRLAAEYKIRKQRVHAILWLKDIQKKMEEEQGGKLDDEIEKSFEKIHGSYTKAGGEKHVKVMYTEPNFEVVSDDWEGEVKADAGLTVEELSAREEEMLVKEFEQRMEFNKKQMDGMIKAKKMDRKRPKEGWSYVIEDIGKNAKRGKGGGKRFISDPDGTHRPLNELEKMFLRRETPRPRRRPAPR